MKLRGKNVKLLPRGHYGLLIGLGIFFGAFAGFGILTGAPEAAILMVIIFVLLTLPISNGALD